MCGISFWFLFDPLAATRNGLTESTHDSVRVLVMFLLLFNIGDEGSIICVWIGFCFEGLFGLCGSTAENHHHRDLGGGGGGE